jgi:N-acyl homoserine lactone hydrolase
MRPKVSNPKLDAETTRRAESLGRRLRFAALLSAVLWAGCARIGDLTVTTLAPPRAPVADNWPAVFARARPFAVTGLVTGYVEAGPEILIDTRDARVPAQARRRMWVPSVAYLVEQPGRAPVLLDTGVRGGDCAYGVRPFYWVPCRNAAGSDALSQLAARGLAPGALDFVVISHFHGDHASGLAALLRAGAPRIVTTGAELDAIRSEFRAFGGYNADMLQERMRVVTIDGATTTMPIVGRVVDVYGDGSLWLIPVPGHSPGLLAALVNAQPRPVLFTFDASHLRIGFELGVPPGFTADRAAAVASLARLRALADAYPAIRVVYGHEPSQWPAGQQSLVLTRAQPPDAARASDASRPH